MRFPTGATGTYLLAAVVADASCCEEPRQQLRNLRKGRQPRLHWRDEDTAQRRKISSTVAAFDMASVVVVGMPLEPSKQERGRAQCMDRLLMELDSLGVTTVYLEQRTPSLNKRDMVTVDRLRGRELISGSLRVELAQPSTEPMLWIPDAVAGAVRAAHEGERQWLDAMSCTVEEIEIRLR